MHKLDEKIAKLEQEKQAKSDELERLKSLRHKINTKRVTIEDLAGLMHSTLCRWNHTDGCGFEYEKDWSGNVHQEWIRKAEKVASVSDITTAYLVIEALNAS